MSSPFTSLEKFYREIAAGSGLDIDTILPKGIEKEIGHFNVFDIAALNRQATAPKQMPYDRRAYYKISLIRGRNRAEYADKVIDITENALLFATPKIPYNWLPQDSQQSGLFCVFSEAFMIPSKSAVILDDLPLFKSGGYPVFQLTNAQADHLEGLFHKMSDELNSDYAYKYDLLRNLVMEVIHYGQKLQPVTALYPSHNAASRVVSLFIELLERQFPVDAPNQRLQLRTAKDFAERLAIHVNHLNKVLKENTGSTTTSLINGRILQEAKILLRQTDWNVSEIAYALGFEEPAHFSNFFKKRTSLTPLQFRS